MTLVVDVSVERSSDHARPTVSVNYRERESGSERLSPADLDSVPPLLAYAPALLAEFFAGALGEGWRARVEASRESNSAAGFPRICDDAAGLRNALHELREYSESGASTSVYPVSIWLWSSAHRYPEALIGQYRADRGNMTLFLELIQSGVIWSDLEDAYCDIMASARNAPSLIRWMEAACRKIEGGVHCALELP
ncbi:MAG TPA: hypothetical protein VGO40_10220 [Longimicrobium sp.]|jgi:hypothetical protein|nr:hypothetical protein [Longimicrobium sp.]